ncbi:MAG: CoA transferase [Betaproteobacteria bacterium]|jgi:crotonobetainyl-CoA:carnitine CoA-transferase CaiB-like acyl-CoA transferase
MNGPLENIRVIDITRALTGPFCTMILADLGADVIKVEIPGRGDEARHWGPPFANGSGPSFLGYNRNKRSIEVDLHHEQGQQQIRDLAATADVLVENFRPGTMDRFGVGYDVIKKIKPDIVYCSISGYGQSGSLSNWPAMDLMIQAVSGIMSLTGEAEGRPHKAAAPITDLFAGFSAAISVLAAIHARSQNGQGRAIDISMLDSAFTILGQAVTAWGIDQKEPIRSGNAHPLMAPYQSFRTQSQEIVCAITTQKRWEKFCSIPEFQAFKNRDDLANQTLRNACRISLCEELESIFLTKNADYWLAHMFTLELPAAPVNTLSQIATHEHVVQRGSLMEIEYPKGSGNMIKIPGMPWRDVASDKPMRMPPALGEHNEEIREEVKRFFSSQKK